MFYLDDLTYQMATGARLLCSVGLCKAEYVSHGWNDRFQIKLRRLRQVGLLAVVVQVEESGAPLDLGLHNSRRGHLEVAAVEVVIAETLHHH